MKTISKKVCLLGDFAVGKTSLVRRFVYDLFDDKYISTIGVKVSRKTVVLPNNDQVLELTMMLWDLAGTEEFDQIRASYLRGSAGAVLVCDLTRPETIDSLQSYTDNLLSTNADAQVILAANKLDLIDQVREDGLPHLGPEQVASVAASLDVPMHLTSAKSGEEVETMFRHLGQLLLARQAR
jgi:small GTP-binding protein